MKNENLGIMTTTLSTLTTMVQANLVFQYIQLGISIFCGLLTLAYTMWKWYKKATSDGKITSDEIEELGDNIHKIGHDTEEEIKESLDKINRGEK